MTGDAATAIELSIRPFLEVPVEQATAYEIRCPHGRTGHVMSDTYHQAFSQRSAVRHVYNHHVRESGCDCPLPRALCFLAQSDQGPNMRLLP